MSPQALINGESMSVPEQKPIVVYKANGTTTNFPITFDLHDTEQIFVVINNEVPEVGAYTVLNKEVVFTVAPKNGDEITVSRMTALERETNYKSFNNSFRPQSLNWDFNKIWHVLQESNLIDAHILARLKQEIEWRRTHDANIVENIDNETEQRRALDQRIRDEITQELQDRQAADDQIRNEIEQEVSARRALDLNYDMLAQARDMQVFAALKQYLDTIIASATPNIFGGVTAGVVFALDKKSIQTHLEEILDQLATDRADIDSKADSNSTQTALEKKANIIDVYYKEEVFRKSETYSSQIIDQKIATVAGGNYAFNTLAEFEAVKTTIPANSTVTISESGANQGDNIWDGAILTKSIYDPLQIARGEAYKVKGSVLNNSLLSEYKKLGIWYGEANLTLSDKPSAASTAAFVLYVEPYNQNETLVIQTYQETLDLKAIFKRIINVNTNTVVQTWNKVTDISRSNLLDSFLYSGVLTSADDLNPLRKDGTFIATSVPINAPIGETGSAFITIKSAGAFTHQTYQRLNDSRYRYERVVQRLSDTFSAEAWRDISFLGSSNIATPSKVGTVKPSTGLTVAADGSLSVANLARAQFADDFNYVSGLNATNDLNVKMKEGSYLTLAVPLNAPTGINPNVLITNQNVGQRYIQTIYDLVDSRKRWQRIVRFNSDGTFNSAEVWKDLFKNPRDGLADSFLYSGVLTSENDLNTTVKDGVYITTSVPINAPTGVGTINFVTVAKAGAFIKQVFTDATNAVKSWTRAFQNTSPITGGVWVSNNPADHIATTSKVGGVKVGAGLNVTSDGTLSLITPSQINPFAGKKIVCFGDSITEFKTYPQQLGQMLGAEGINVGFGGCMMGAHWTDDYKEMCMYRLADYIASGDYSGLIAAAQDLYDRTKDDNRAIAARLAAIDWNTVDYVTIFYGTNDFANGKALGSATETVSDGSTYLGSANYAIQRLQAAYPHLKIALITPIYRARGANGGTDSDDSPNATTNGKYLREFVAGLIEVAKLNHIPCFNMHDESGINKYTRGLYLNPDPDGVHLTDVGATHIAQKLAAKMRANF